MDKYEADQWAGSARRLKANAMDGWNELARRLKGNTMDEWNELAIVKAVQFGGKRYESFIKQGHNNERYLVIREYSSTEFWNDLYIPVAALVARSVLDMAIECLEREMSMR